MNLIIGHLEYNIFKNTLKKVCKFFLALYLIHKAFNKCLKVKKNGKLSIRWQKKCTVVDGVQTGFGC